MHIKKDIISSLILGLSPSEAFCLMFIQQFTVGISAKNKTAQISYPAFTKRKFMLLMIDNYDSFTYNLVQHLGEIGEDIKVFRNDKVTIKDIEELKPKSIVISPGPCTPKEAGVSVDVIKYFGGKIPILGVCLGHQAIAAAFGGDIIGRRGSCTEKHP